MNKYLSQKNYKQIMNRILNNGIQNNEEKQFYLDYLNEKMQNLISQNKIDNKENFRNIFSKYLWKHYTHLHNDDNLDFIELYYALSIFGVLIVGLPIEIGLYHTLDNLYALKLFIGLMVLPVVISFIRGIFKTYLPNRKKLKFEFNKNKKELKEEIEYVNSLHFKKEKEEKNANYHEERYILGAKEKTTIYKRIADIIVKLKDVNNQEKMQQLITKVQNILQEFEEAIKKFENINPSEEHLIIQDKIGIYSKISFKLDEVEQELENLLHKQERIEEDNRQIENLNNKLKTLKY